MAGPEDRALFEKAVALLAPHEAYFRGDHCWNYRMGYAYYYLDREDAALRYFRQALEARPGDRDTLEFMENCLHCLALPRFTRCFRVRAEEAWAAFAERDADLRAAMDGSPAGKEEALETCRRLLGLALGDPAVALGRRGERYQLVLSPAGSHARLFPLVFFRRRAPERVL